MMDTGMCPQGSQLCEVANKLKCSKTVSGGKNCYLLKIKI